MDLKLSILWVVVSKFQPSFTYVLQQQSVEKIRVAVESENESKMDRWKENSWDIKVEEEEVWGLRQRYKLTARREEGIQCSLKNRPN